MDFEDSTDTESEPDLIEYEDYVVGRRPPASQDTADPSYEYVTAAPTIQRQTVQKPTDISVEVIDTDSSSDEESDPEFEEGPLSEYGIEEEVIPVEFGADIDSKEFKKFVRGLKKQLVLLKEQLCSVKERVGSQPVDSLIGSWIIEQQKIDDPSKLP
eukprot:CAMPEP_0114587588 /NCGR_PEP_ID=MMETSP0125-20121206/10519_1 /TAXON_ID=485358 ORGANISM="Aristerostoma sp., Strain ATCC 50986" /NCGR_SAMPLE_ID=MMETSP0125 /ASSEMBLY_ACC=CAM_ASM_000245 /LENGTH=156 /DNA_ID=CAMNT_0001783591 /DNA_START=159 /DNA_END=629 /DNA_ORIENTATION=-